MSQVTPRPSTVVKEFTFRTHSRAGEREEKKHTPLTARPPTANSVLRSSRIENMKSTAFNPTTPRSPKLLTKNRSRKSLTKENEHLNESIVKPVQTPRKSITKAPVDDTPKGAYGAEQNLIKELIQVEHDHDVKFSFYPIDKNRVTTTFERLCTAMKDTTRCPQFSKLEITPEKVREVLRAHKNAFAVEVEVLRSGEKSTIIRVKNAEGARGLSDGNVAKKPVWFIVQ
jgi:hypothetical protein